MASVTSLGLHQPTALSHFIQERLVGPEPSNDDYTWQTEASNGADDQDGDDELLVTKTCVAWSRGGILRKAYRFEVEEEPVTRAILTYFAPPMKAKNGGIQGKDTTEKEELRNTSQSKSDHSQDQQKSKALVVFLKTQAHVYFLSGTSHVVHLPFEIEYAAAAPNGVIMQRKPQAQKHISGSLKFPKVPPNSFISSQPQPWSANSSVQSTFSIASLGSPKQLMLPQTSLLGDLWQTPTLKDDTNWPRLFSLTDPLSEMGLVVTAGSSDGSRRTSLKTLALDPAEEIIHVTERGEFSSIESSNCDPLILAMTVNRETSICTVWRVTYVEQEDIIRSRPAHTSGAVSRRRSSFAPGTGTGATTPVGNSQYTFRESLGGNSLVVPKNSNRHQDDTPEEKLNFAASLDPDFESAALPRRKSRRVSSMLARADLSASHERSAFSELASAHPPHAGRRGDSLGSQHNRTSFGHHISINGHANLGSSQLGNSLNSFLEAPVDDLLDELRAGGDFEGFHNMGLDDEDFEGLRKEIIFTKIESLPLEQSNVRFSIQREPAQKQCRVFTLVAPPCASEDPRKSQIVICALDINEKKLLVLTLDTDRQTKMVHSGYSSRKRGSDSEKDIIKISCGESKRANGVLDACKLTDGSITRILILTESSDGQGYLTLQAPWSVLTTVSLPQQLALNNLRSLGHDPVPQKRRDGGFGRVLSQGAGALRSLKNSMPGGMVDVLDDDGKLHQLNIRMEPLNPAVKQIINVCRFVLPGARSREAVLVCWWNAMQWLGGDNKKVCDSEWTAIVITLFSMILGTQDRANQSSPDRKRRSKQSLRSSSGAQPDDENWQLMLGHELANGFSHPSWMTNKGWEWLSEQQITRPSSSGRPNSSSSWAAGSRVADDHPGFLQRHIKLTREFLGSNLGQTAAGPSGYLPTAPNKRQDTCRNAISDIIVGLHLLREEQKLDIGCTDSINSGAGNLVLVLAQLCKWVGWHEWVSGYDVEDALTEFIILDSSKPISIQPPSSPPDVYEWIESCLVSRKLSPFVSIADITASRSTLGHQAAPHIEQWSTLTPRTAMFGRFFAKVQPDSLPSHLVEALYDAGIGAQILDTLPESVLVPLRETIVNCQDQPPLTWGQDLLGFVDRDDVNMLLFPEQRKQLAPSSTLAPTHEASVDVHSVCSSLSDPETIGSFDGSAEVDRQAITRLIFKDDRRFNEAAKILNTSKTTLAYVEPEPDWSESDLLEAQKEHAQMLALRTLAIPSGRGLLYFSARVPLLTEKFPMAGFNLNCVMKPNNNTVGVEKNSFSEEKVCWAFFHSGVSAGLSISRNAKGIDTSWILYNKPPELTNRHAGFLLALGLNGHLKSIAKWVAFKYLTPKHTMTSIGLLLGLAASYLGTMDSLITRLLSVHVTRMLPPGAAELNLSPLTQTTGIMGIGLLYCNTQHRRMSEIMVSEIEHTDPETEDEPLRNEGYRLAAGFSLGFINLGKGSDLKGLHDMRLTERLIRLAAGSKKVDLVHVLDKATAASVVAIALIFMKSEDVALARKIDVPTSDLQYDYVRPDIFLLRTLARNLIMWSKIEASSSWIEKSLPSIYQERSKLSNVHHLSTEDLPFYDIITGLLFSIALRHAGSGSTQVRDLLIHFLDQMMRISKLPATTYDEKLTRTTTRNCLDLLALAVSTVMAGTGDLLVFRRLRALHGRDDPETPYGSHLAAHLAIGALFLGGGTYTFGTSNLAIAALIVAFYPLFPASILDNKSHLQAFRHFWVLAAEPRCLVARDLDTNQPVSIPLSVTLLSGAQTALHAPCLLPDLSLISTIKTNSRDYWNIVLDFGNDKRVNDIFTKNQTMWIRKKQANDANLAIFQASLQAFDDTDGSSWSQSQPLEWLFNLDAFKNLTKAERALVLGTEYGAAGMDTETTLVDTRLVLEKASLDSGKRDRLQGLKLLFAWKEEIERRGGEMHWIRGSVVDGLKARVWLMGSENQGI